MPMPSDPAANPILSAAEVIYENVDADANIIFGALVDESMPAGEVSITVLATGFESADYFDDAQAAAPAAKQSYAYSAAEGGQEERERAAEELAVAVGQPSAAAGEDADDATAARTESGGILSFLRRLFRRQR